MSKIIEHTFKIPNLVLEGNKLVEKGEITETYTFTFLFKGMGTFEEISKEPLINTLADLMKLDENEQVKKIMNSKFLLNLASASYVKIENGRFYNNRATCEEFKKMNVANHLNDIDFIIKIFKMSIECLIGKDVKLEDKKKKEEAKEELEEQKN